MRIDKTIEVEVPLSVAYNQWTQFEEFPRFMEGVTEVEQLENERLHWGAELNGHHKEWYSHITRQVPDEVLAWEAEGGALNSGTIVFHPKEAEKTEIEVHMDYEPADFTEEIGGALGFLDRRVSGDLKRFKEFIETRGVETGGWRGEILHGATNDEQSQMHTRGSGLGGNRAYDGGGGGSGSYTGPDFEGTTSLERGPEIPAADEIRDSAPTGGSYARLTESEADIRADEREDRERLLDEDLGTETVEERRLEGGNL